jgi:hypothetical protein
MATKPNVTIVPYDTHKAVALSPHVIAKIYQLSSMFYAEKGIAEESLAIAKNHPPEWRRFHSTEMEQLRDELFMNLATTLLTEISIYVRIIDDKLEGQYTISDEEDAQCENCGTLTAKGTTSSLSMREACNKIIHAKQFEFFVSWLSVYEVRRAISSFQPTVRFHGALGSSKWVADLDVQRYCNAVTKVCRITLFGHQ